MAGDAETETIAHLSQTHLAEIDKLLANIATDSQDQRDYERCLERYQFLLDQYQEQPHLLDAVLPRMVQTILNVIDIKNLNEEVMQSPKNTLAFRYLHHTCKVRGDRVLLRLLPHEPDFVEPVISTLVVAWQANLAKYLTIPWETEYMLLLWMVILAKTPFDLSRFDGTRTGETLVSRIHLASVNYVTRTDKTQQVASLLFAELLSRPDVSKDLLNKSVQESLNALKGIPDLGLLAQSRTANAQLQLLARILKQARRADLLPLINDMLDVIIELPVEKADTTVRKLACKVIQRIALVFLPPRIAKWRYQRGSRSLTANLQQQPQETPALKSETDKTETNDDEEDEDVPEQLEPVVDRLLTTLSDRDTVVRWSAAKGVGRICNRLPHDAAADVVNGVFAVFDRPADDDCSWHGACLALAELARRGLVLPCNLSNVVEVLCKCLVFDRQRGRHSVGSHLRDAACYVCWSLARAFEPEQIKETKFLNYRPYANRVSATLLTVAVADREVNVRRAAAAAFQENVGRQSASVPHGIDIVTTVDYQAVGQRQRCYTQLAAFVAGMDEYVEIYTDHLLSLKIGHWDETVRRQCAMALNQVGTKRPEYTHKHVVENLSPRCLIVTDMFERQGALLSLGACLLALASTTYTLTSSVPAVKKWSDIFTTIHGKADVYYRGIAADITKAGVNDYVRDLAKSILIWLKSDSTKPLESDDNCQLQLIVESLRLAVAENLPHLKPEIRQSAAEALEQLHLCMQLVSGNTDTISTHVTSSYIPLMVSASIEWQRQAGAVALASLPAAAVDASVIDNLVTYATCYDKTSINWADARVDCLKALATLHERLGDAVDDALVGTLYACYLKAFNDYTIDKRGDIGRYVRDAAIVYMTGLLSQEISRLNKEQVNAAVGKILQQSCEKIDHTRLLAVNNMQILLRNEAVCAKMDQVPLLIKVFIESPTTDLIYDVDFDRLCALVIADAPFSRDVLISFIVSAGGLSESTQRTSSKALMSVLGEPNMGPRLLSILREYSRVDRIMTPLLNVLDTALSSDSLCTDTDDKEWLTEMFECVAKETLLKKSPRRVNLGVSVCCAFIQFDDMPELRTAAIDKVSKCLLHVYPVVRRATADKLYEAILMFGQLDNHSEWVMNILSETRWDEPIEDLKELVEEMRAKLCPVD